MLVRFFGYYLGAGVFVYLILTQWDFASPVNNLLFVGPNSAGAESAYFFRLVYFDWFVRAEYS